MQTENTITIRGPIERVFALASDVTRWPEILPHYRYVRLVSGSERRRVVEMAAHRDGIPVRWTAVQQPIPDEKRILFWHIKGPTTGMEVEWSMYEQDGVVHVKIFHEFNSSIPLVGGIFARHIVGRFFVHNIAGKTLAAIKRIVEGETGRKQTKEPE